MQPITEFSFDGIDITLSKKYIEIHNLIYNDINALKSSKNDVAVNTFLEIFLNKFSLLDQNEPNLVDKTVICCSLKDVGYFITNSNESDLIRKVKTTDLDISKFNPITKNYLEAKRLPSVDNEVTLLEILSVIFNYAKRRKYLLKYYSSTEFNVCLFCLAQSTTTYTSSKNKKVYLTGNLDHINPKSKFPFLAISLNNLIPVCAHCNQRKSYNPFEYNPFNQLDKHQFDFSDCLETDERKRVVLKTLDKLKVDKKKGNTSDLITKLDFRDLYKNFSGNAKIMVERFHKFHSNGYKVHLESILNKKDVTSEMKYFISEIPLIDKNIVKYPLAKFKIDLYKELKQKYDQNKVKSGK